jgi:putative transcriptional regulator
VVARSYGHRLLVSIGVAKLSSWLVGSPSNDADAQPYPEGVPLRNAWRGPHPRFLRIKLGLSPEEFAARYHIPLDQLLQWEIQKPYPDKMAQAYLRTIAADPEGVALAVAGKQQQAAE